MPTLGDADDMTATGDGGTIPPLIIPPPPPLLPIRTSPLLVMACSDIGAGGGTDMGDGADMTPPPPMMPPPLTARLLAMRPRSLFLVASDVDSCRLLLDGHFLWCATQKLNVHLHNVHMYIYMYL